MVSATPTGSSVQTLYKIVDGKAEALEFIAADSFEFLKVPIKDMHIKKSILLACIIRGGRIIYPHGGDTIEAGDSVIGRREERRSPEGS